MQLMARHIDETITGQRPKFQSKGKKTMHEKAHATRRAIALFCQATLTFVSLLAIDAIGHAQPVVGTVANIPAPDSNAFSTSLRYDSSGNLYAWNGLSVWKQSGTGSFENIGSAAAGNSADAGPITFSQDGQTLLLSNGAGGAMGGNYNGKFFTLPVSGGSGTVVSGGSVQYTGDSLALPATSTIPSSSTKYLVYAGSAFTGGPVAVSVSVFDAATGATQVLINSETGATASITINPQNHRLYVAVGFGNDQGKIFSFSQSQIDNAYSGSPIRFSSGTVFNSTAQGSQNGAGMFFDNNGYLFSGGGGLTVFRPDGTICFDRPAGSADGYYETLTFNPATNQVLKVAPFSASPSTGILYKAGDFEPASWTNGNGGQWGVGSNWIGRPLTTVATLIFAGSTNGTATVSLDGSQTAAALQFGDTTSSSSYMISAGTGGALTLGTTADGAAIAVQSGTQTISAPVVLEGNLAVTNSAGTALLFSGNISQDTGVMASLSLSGGGTLILSGTNSFSGGVTVDGGRLVLTHAYDLPNGSSLTVGNPIASPGPAAGAAIVPQTAAAVPEPSSLAICLLAGFLGCAFRRRFRLAVLRIIA
jgi:autotransporter-associated beta strand protein